MAKSTTRLDFIIVGASISGLATAIALKASGHNVLVLEKETQLGGTNSQRIVPPNGTKILFDWGLGTEARNNSAILDGFAIYRYEGTETGRDFLGSSLRSYGTLVCTVYWTMLNKIPNTGMHRWDLELIREARGNFLHFRHQDLLRILYDAAIRPPRSEHKSSQNDDGYPRVSVLFGAEVVEVNCDTCTVTLRSGAIHVGDAIIGADGAGGVVRRTLMHEEDAVPGRDDVPMGQTLYAAVIPKALTANDPDLTSFYEHPESTASMGSNRGALTFAVGKDRDITVWVYTPDSSPDGSWGVEAQQKLTDILGPCDVGLRKLAALAGPATCVQIKDLYELKSWVSQSGRVVVLGEAAHPFPPGSLQTYAIALEDGAFIGKIFSHTRNRARIPEFLHAFQEHREPRCTRIRNSEKGYIGAMTLPDGAMQAGRDTAMRTNTAEGRDVMDTPGSDTEAMLDEMRVLFGYDPADDADEWWMAWGRFKDTPRVPTDEEDKARGWLTFSSITNDHHE
ncbi:hypothetical protein B0H19DRAFT_1247480 [Mycena capillaripes]|nr:hypothetical protein B0H19DRAFT_1247480 [Mycena capillaripes]